jgi:hypothetical protein
MEKKKEEKPKEGEEKKKISRLAPPSGWRGANREKQNEVVNLLDGDDLLGGPTKTNEKEEKKTNEIEQP